MVHLWRPAALLARSRPATPAAVGTVSPGRRLSQMTKVQCLSFGLSDSCSLVAATCQPSQVPLCYQQARLKLTLIANSIVDFVARCFCFQVEPDFTRKAVLGSFANPGSRRGGGYPG